MPSSARVDQYPNTVITSRSISVPGSARKWQAWEATRSCPGRAAAHRGSSAKDWKMCPAAVPHEAPRSGSLRGSTRWSHTISPSGSPQSACIQQRACPFLAQMALHTSFNPWDQSWRAYHNVRPLIISNSSLASNAARSIPLLFRSDIRFATSLTLQGATHGCLSTFLYLENTNRQSSVSPKLPLPFCQQANHSR